MTRIDFNCDLGEGCGNDAAIAPLVSSASIACGGHAGDHASMRQTIALCLRHCVAIGAHPSFEDREHFGRREIAITPGAVTALVARQIADLASACADQQTHLSYVKPHGALYNLAARDAGIAAAIASTVRAQDPSLVLYALSGSTLADAGESAGLRVAHEAFVERRYESDGSLAPRGTTGAVIEEVADALAQLDGLLNHGRVTTRSGQMIPIRADTICLHGDRADAPAFARALRDRLTALGVQILAPGAG